jgi:hypothetical protein
MSLITLFGIILAIVAITWIVILIAKAMDASPKQLQIITIVGIIVTVFYVLSAFGVWGLFHSIQVPTVR